MAKIFRLIRLIMVLLFLSGVTLPPTGAVDSNIFTERVGAEKSIIRLEGTWVNEEYIRNVQKYLSPIRAVKLLHGYPSFRFSRRADDRKWILDIEVAFHQGLGGEIHQITRLAAGKYRVFLRDNQKSYDMEWHADGGAVPKIILMGPNQATFVKIPGTVEEYVNDLILAGEYQDDAGRNYRFSRHKLAQWPDRSFMYRLNLDPVFIRNDYFVDESNRERLIFYCFEWRKQRLCIYHAHVPEGSEWIVPDQNPFLVLKKKALLSNRTHQGQR